MSRMSRWILVPLCFASALGLRVFADGLKDNLPDQVRPVPPIGIEVSEKDRAELKEGMARLEDGIAQLKKRADSRTQNLLPDVEIFARAVAELRMLEIALGTRLQPALDREPIDEVRHLSLLLQGGESGTNRARRPIARTSPESKSHARPTPTPALTR